MVLEDLGYTRENEAFRIDNDLGSFEIGRISAEHKERYVVKTIDQEFDAEITGNLRYTADDRADYPAVGDWVAFLPFEDAYGIIYHIFPRSTVLERQAVGKFGEKQIIAANIDYSLIIQSVDRDYNINRLERYLSISHVANIQPIVLLSKTDLIDEEILVELILGVKKKHPNVPVFPFSNIVQSGLDKIKNIFEKGKTFCFLGSSGVGKSTLINNLSGRKIMKTNEISQITKKGKHTTSHREMIILDSGAILIDTPGMREIGITDQEDITFDEIGELARDCKYVDCSHQHEDSCAVLAALEDQRIDRFTYDNFLKMEREANRFQSTIAEKRKKDKKFGRMYKEAIKYRKKNKY